jgi:transcriptional regulator with XRE-family HTH domain
MARRQLGNLDAPPARRRRQVIRIGGPLSALLDERFITQAELARDVGVHEQNVSRWCRNETGPTKTRLRRIAQHLGVEPAELIDSDAISDRVAA